MGTHYVRNEHGHIHSVDEDHFENRLHTVSPSGNRFMLPGWSEVDEATARHENPQLFGTPDPEVTREQTAEDLQRETNRRQALAALQASV